MGGSKSPKTPVIMDTISISSQSREKFGTSAAVKIRAEGGLPANVIGAGKPTVAITLDMREFEAALRHNARVFELKVEGEKNICILQDVQRDYMGDHFQHVDFLRDPDGSAALAQEEAAATEEAERLAAAEKAAAEATAAAEAALAAAEAAEAEAEETGEEGADGDGSEEEE